MEDSTHLIWSVIFGGIGLGFFTYGRKQKAVFPFFTGIALFLFPYLISNNYMLVFVGIILVILPYFVCKYI